MIRHLMLLAVLVLAGGCAGSQKSSSVPPGWERIPTRDFENFDGNEILAAARKLIGYQGPMALMPVNGWATDNDLNEINDGLLDLHSRGEPVVFIGRDETIVADALGRALAKAPGIDLNGERIIIAAPAEPSKDFQVILSSRKIRYYYLPIVPGKRPPPKVST